METGSIPQMSFAQEYRHQMLLLRILFSLA